VPPPPRRKSSLRPVWEALAGVGIFAVGIGVGLLLAGDGGQTDSSSSNRPAATEAEEPTTTPLEDAKETCAPTTSGVRIGDNGTTLIIDSAGADEDPQSEIYELVCILMELDVPDSIISHMDHTRALDGRQNAEWGDYEATWIYHPDQGLNLTITLVR
jgi:hypothetical protein